MSQLSEILHGGSGSSKNSKSFIARLGQLGQKYTDPLAWIFGRKYTDKLVGIADFSNRQLSSVASRDPMIKLDKKYNPLQQIPAIKKAGDWTTAKPADAAAIAAGAYFGGAALGSAMGGSGGSAGSPGGTSSSGFFNFDYTNPQSYTRFAQMGNGQNQQQAQADAAERARRAQEQEAERRRRYAELTRQDAIRQQIAQSMGSTYA